MTGSQLSRSSREIGEGRNRCQRHWARRMRETCLSGGNASEVPTHRNHRPSHHESGQHPKPVAQPVREGAVEGGVRDWGEVVSKLRPPLATVGEKLGCMLENPHVSRATSRLAGRENASGDADNQQGSRLSMLSFDGLTPQRLVRQAPGRTAGETRQEGRRNPLEIATRDQDEDTVRAPWRHGESREQGSRTGRCGWITSFLRSSKGTPS